MRIDRAAFDALLTRDLSPRDRELLAVLAPKFRAAEVTFVEVSEADWAVVPSEAAIRASVGARNQTGFDEPRADSSPRK